MSENKSGLGELVERLQRGVQSMGKGRVEPQIDENAHFDNESHNASELGQSQPDPEPQPHAEVADHDDLLDPSEESQPQPQKLGERLAALTGKQKVLLIAVVLVAAFAAKSHLESPSSIAPQTGDTSTAVAQPEGGESQTTEPAFQSFTPTSGSFDDSTGLSTDEDGGELKLSLDEKTGDFASAAIATEEDIAPLKAMAQQVPEDAAEVADDPLGPIGGFPNDMSSSETPIPAFQPSGNPVNPTELGQVEADGPFGQAPLPSVGEGTLAGAVSQGVDSSQGAIPPLEQKPAEPEIAAKVADLESLIRKQSESIKSLEVALASAEKKAKQSASVVPAESPTDKPAKRPIAPAVKKSAPVNQRPNFCVKAVAQVARNCSTCVAHAFVVHNRMETMVGHGDQIDEYRVSISGDRIELQGPPGTQPHKFWPMPTGCSN